MAKKLNPTDLRSFIDKDRRFKRAEALLNNQWESLLLNDALGMMLITLADISYAKKLSAANLVITDIDLKTFAGVQDFILSNQMRLSPNVINALREPFL